MAPKSRTPPLLAGVLKALEENETGQPDDISDSLLQRLYRLKDADKITKVILKDDSDRVLKIGPIHQLKACSNIWDTPEKVKAALQLEANSGDRKRAKLDADLDEGEEPVIPVGCWKSDCAKKPRCLNWLGQSTWEQSMSRYCWRPCVLSDRHLG